MRPFRKLIWERSFVLNVRQLEVRYGATEVLRGVTLEVPQGDIVALLGGNGAGKSSLLNTLSGLVRPSGGDVVLFGRSVAGAHPSEIVRQGMTQVPQGRYVWTGMSVVENLQLGGVTQSRVATARRLERALEMFPVLQAKRRQLAGALSGGEQQMVAIARALMADPRMLLLDEPSAGLSPLMVEAMIEAIARLHRDGLGILLVEQNIGVAQALAGTALVLANGEIVLRTTGTALSGNRELFDSYFGV
jgi:branched-chain amino acid transport system ATP-binding protein